MKLCIPKIGSLLLLTEDWTVSLDEDHKQISYTWSIEQQLDIPFQRVKYMSTDYMGKPFEREKLVGTLTIPKGSILKLGSIEAWSNRQKRYHSPDRVMFEIVETTLPFKVDKEVLKTKTGRVSKKQKKRPTVSFYAEPAAYNNIEFEFTV